MLSTGNNCYFLQNLFELCAHTSGVHTASHVAQQP